MNKRRLVSLRNTPFKNDTVARREERRVHNAVGGTQATQQRSHSVIFEGCDAGFTLLEIIIVLAIIGAIASVIIPSLTLTFESQMSVSLKTLTAQMYEAYNDALFSDRLHRMVVNVKTGEYWVEQAPLNFKGRPPLMQSENIKNTVHEDAAKTLYDSLEEKAKNQSDREAPYSTKDNPSYYSMRSIPVVQRDVLLPIKWTEVDTPTISKSKLKGNVIFAKFRSEISSKEFAYTELVNNLDKDENNFAYIYFLPHGEATPTSIQLAIKNEANTIDDEAPKYTVNLSTLTGQSRLLQGFQDANFTLPKK